MLVQIWQRGMNKIRNTNPATSSKHNQRKESIKKKNLSVFSLNYYNLNLHVNRVCLKLSRENVTWVCTERWLFDVMACTFIFVMKMLTKELRTRKGEWRDAITILTLLDDTQEIIVIFHGWADFDITSYDMLSFWRVDN